MPDQNIPDTADEGKAPAVNRGVARDLRFARPCDRMAARMALLGPPNLRVLGQESPTSAPTSMSKTVRKMANRRAALIEKYRTGKPKDHYKGYLRPC